MRQKLELTLDDAKKIAAAARVEADRQNWKVVIAVVDDGGHLIYLERADGTQKAASVVAVEKARTAIMFRRPTKAFEDTIASGRVAVMTMPGATTIEGGLPIVVNGEFIGAIGVSGVQSSQDAVIANAGLAALKDG
jgi:glc operon protein GlcG